MGFGLGVVLGRQGPRLSIRIDIWILPSDTETSARGVAAAVSLFVDREAAMLSNALMLLMC